MACTRVFLPFAPPALHLIHILIGLLDCLGLFCFAGFITLVMVLLLIG